VLVGAGGGYLYRLTTDLNLSVMNGTGAADQAADTASALGALGFHTMGVGDVSSTGDVSETVVYYGSHNAATVAAAEAVARSITGSVIMGYDPSQVADGAEVRSSLGEEGDEMTLEEIDEADGADVPVEVLAGGAFTVNWLPELRHQCPTPSGRPQVRRGN
jgi:hypothetical protein